MHEFSREDHFLLLSRTKNKVVECRDASAHKWQTWRQFPWYVQDSSCVYEQGQVIMLA